MPTELTIEAMLTHQTRRQLTKRGVSLHTVKQQLTTFQQGLSFAKLKKPCVLNDGIRLISASELPSLIQAFEKATAAGRVTKFVPASGAATRMFKSLMTYHQQPVSTTTSSSDQRVLEQFFTNLSKFAFYHDLRNALARQTHDLDQLASEKNYQPILTALLYSRGLNYANLPKGLLAFHRYAATTRTPIEEHLVEAAAYAKDARGHARVHFTVSPDHQRAIQRHIEQARHGLAPDTVTWVVTCSVQRPSTDTIAVDVDNHPFHDSQGNLLFRPAGHGALLSNLHELHGDVVFIENIDNVVPDHLKEANAKHKKTLGGLLVSLQDTLFSFLTQLESDTASSGSIEQITEWAQQSLGMTLPEAWSTRTNSQKTQWLSKWLNRPLRICGMVPNMKNPGGGPFWVEREDDTTSLQIVESSQVDHDSPTQQNIFTSSTHFNPVNMVCGVRDYQGNPFNLHQFVDPNAGFISKKSCEGRELKALELPGLWNGGMAKWHSVFVEVPGYTFNPVKTVLDLLLPAHQPPERS